MEQLLKNSMNSKKYILITILLFTTLFSDAEIILVVFEFIAQAEHLYLILGRIITHLVIHIAVNI